MNSDIVEIDPSLSFLTLEGEMRKRIREFDWSKTELGSPMQWPSSLKTSVSIMLDCAWPAYIAWGPRFITFYNDAYIPILGKLKHPHALGQRTQEVWHEIWDFVGARFHAVLQERQAVSMESKCLLMLRNGYLEECYFSFAYSPLTNEIGQVAGVFTTPWETTQQVISKRRTDALRGLAEGLSDASGIAGVRTVFEKTVMEDPQDLPFGLWYEARENSHGLDLVAIAGIESGSVLSPVFLDPKNDDFYAGLIDIHSAKPASRPIGDEKICWSRPAPPDANPQILFVYPLRYMDCPHPDGYMVFAFNPMRPAEEGQEEFFKTICLNIENAVRREGRSALERREREHQFETVMAALPCLVRMSNPQKQCNFVNRTWLQFTGRSIEQELGRGWTEGVHPDDVNVINRYMSATADHEKQVLEYRLRNANGDYRWMLDERTPYYGVEGEFLGYIGTCIDITERKIAEQEILSSQTELRTLYERLQSVREEERYALSREVHDQLGQVLSAAKIDIKLLANTMQEASKVPPKNKIIGELESASSTLEKAIQIVRRLAVELRPPELESQGLAAAINWHARDFERRTKIRCHVDVQAVQFELDDATSRAFFGIFQEVMTNVMRHAKASEVWISLTCHRNWMKLRVRDNGVGIARARAKAAPSVGIGIKCMRERAALIGGRLVVGWVPPRGTLVAATLFHAEDRSALSISLKTR